MSKDRDLFDSDPDPKLYIIDTSAWFNVDLLPNPKRAWEIVFGLIKEGRIIVCPEVIKELKNSSVYQQLQPYEEKLKERVRTSTDIEYLQLIGKITHDHPPLAKPTSKKTPA